MGEKIEFVKGGYYLPKGSSFLMLDSVYMEREEREMISFPSGK